MSGELARRPALLPADHHHVAAALHPAAQRVQLFGRQRGVNEIAQHHHIGAIETDPAVGNFLVRGLHRAHRLQVGIELRSLAAAKQRLPAQALEHRRQPIVGVGDGEDQPLFGVGLGDRNALRQRPKTAPGKGDLKAVDVGPLHAPIKPDDFVGVGGQINRRIKIVGRIIEAARPRQAQTHLARDGLARVGKRDRDRKPAPAFGGHDQRFFGKSERRRKRHLQRASGRRRGRLGARVAAQHPGQTNAQNQAQRPAREEHGSIIKHYAGSGFATRNVDRKRARQTKNALTPPGERVWKVVPGGIRTPDLLIRSQTLYPAELRAHGRPLAQEEIIPLPTALDNPSQSIFFASHEETSRFIKCSQTSCEFISRRNAERNNENI